MNRRESIKITAAFLGGTWVLSACQGQMEKVGPINASLAALIDEVADIILPDSDRSPGAKKAGVGPFIQRLANDCMSPVDVKSMNEGLERIRKEGFPQMARARKIAYIEAMDRESREKHSEDNPHFYVALKELVIWAYFSSETGQTLAQRHRPMPGMYKGDVPYRPSEPAWTSPGFSID
jgi:hypothetical protein